jgi:hypothetical protein
MAYRMNDPYPSNGSKMSYFDEIAEGRIYRLYLNVDGLVITQDGRSATGRDADELIAAVLEDYENKQSLKRVTIISYTVNVAYTEMATLLSHNTHIENFKIWSRGQNRYRFPYTRENQIVHIFNALSCNTHIRAFAIKEIKLSLNFLEVLVRALSNRNRFGLSSPSPISNVESLVFKKTYDDLYVDPVYGSGIGAVVEFMTFSGDLQKLKVTNYTYTNYECMQLARFCLYSQNLHTLILHDNFAMDQNPHLMELLCGALRRNRSLVHLDLTNISLIKTPKTPNDNERIDPKHFSGIRNVDYLRIGELEHKSVYPCYTLYDAFGDVNYLQHLLGDCIYCKSKGKSGNSECPVLWDVVANLILQTI